MAGKQVLLATILAGSFLSPAASALDLLQSYELAVKSDPQILAAEAGYLAAEEAIPQARSALLPNIYVNAFLNNSETKTDGNVTSDYDNTGYELTLSQTIYNHGFYQSLDQAKASVAQAAAGYAAEQQSLFLRVAQSYFNVLAAEDNLRFARAEKKAIARQLEQTQKRFEVGLIPITDVKESQAQYDISVASEIAAQNQLESSRENLNLIIGESPENLAQMANEFPLVMPEPNDINSWTKTAMENNLAIKAAQYAVNAAAAGVRLGNAGHMPSVSLQASASSVTSDVAVSSTGTGEYDIDDTSITLNINIPIYSGGLTSSTKTQAIRKHDQAKYALELQQRVTRQQARNAFLGINASISRVKALKQALSSTQTAVEATQAGFEAGTRTSVEVLNALRNLYRSERDYAQTRYDYALNLLSLKQAAGVLNTEDLKTINQWVK